MASGFELLSRRNYSRVPSDENEIGESSQATRGLPYFNEPKRFIEVPVTEKDTLQGLALQYRCPVGELKRINNISKDFELFAHKTVKVPEKLTLLESVELKVPEELSSRSSSNASDHTDDQPTSSKQAKKLLEKLDKNISKAKTKANGYNESAPLLDNENINISEIAQEISEELITIEREKKAFTFGIFRDILICFAVLGAFALLFIIIDYLENPQATEENLHGSISNSSDSLS